PGPLARRRAALAAAGRRPATRRPRRQPRRPRGRTRGRSRLAGRLPRPAGAVPPGPAQATYSSSVRSNSRQAALPRLANQRHLDEDHFLGAAVEHVVLDAGWTEIGDAAGGVGERFLAALDDPHPSARHRDDHVIVLVPVMAGMGTRNEPVPGDTRPRVL